MAQFTKPLHIELNLLQAFLNSLITGLQVKPGLRVKVIALDMGFLWPGGFIKSKNTYLRSYIS
jgi:hypothetical protein